MREILFRGKRVDNGEWVYGGYYEHITRQISPIGDRLREEDVKHLIIQSGFADWNMPRPLTAIEVIPETVCQFTGLKDIDGTKIFEGDILGCVDRIVRVKWNKEHGLWDSEFLSYTHTPLCSNGIKAFDWKFRAKVIGNIHERGNDE